MQEISKQLAMGSAMVVAVCLLLVFLLLLMLYVELCCSFLWRRQWRRQLQTPLPTVAAATGGGGSNPSTKPQKKSQGDDEVSTPAASTDGKRGGSPRFSLLQKPPVSPTAAPYYAHGVLQTPASFFFTTVPHAAASTKQGEMLGSRETPLRPSSKTSFHFIGLIPSPRRGLAASACGSTREYSGGSCTTPEEHFFRISNPIYEGASSSTGAGADEDDGSSTPFKTPDTSPLRLEMDDFGDYDEGEGELQEELEHGEDSPALEPMKKLPPALPLGVPAACLADGRRSLATSISVTDTNRPSSSSSSNSTGTIF